jgi:hypothetical protein
VGSVFTGSGRQACRCSGPGSPIHPMFADPLRVTSRTRRSLSLREQHAPGWTWLGYTQQRVARRTPPYNHNATKPRAAAIAHLEDPDAQSARSLPSSECCSSGRSQGRHGTRGGPARSAPRCTIEIADQRASDSDLNLVSCVSGGPSRQRTCSLSGAGRPPDRANCSARGEEEVTERCRGRVLVPLVRGLAMV